MIRTLAVSSLAINTPAVFSRHIPKLSRGNTYYIEPGRIPRLREQYAAIRAHNIGHLPQAPLLFFFSPSRLLSNLHL